MDGVRGWLGWPRRDWRRFAGHWRHGGHRWRYGGHWRHYGVRGWLGWPRGDWRRFAGHWRHGGRDLPSLRSWCVRKLHRPNTHLVRLPSVHNLFLTCYTYQSTYGRLAALAR
jgi:hypothetical protein